MIYLKNVCKAYGKQEVLKYFTFAVEKGERIALMGRSGAGKTTILELIAGLQRADSGKVELPRDLKIGMVFQEDRLIETLTAAANCRLAAAKGTDAAQVEAMLDRLGIGGELSKKPVSELSGGERRRAAIARALLAEADVFILDEPFKGIDAATLPSVIKEVSAAAEGKTLILVTHTRAEAEALGCRIVEI